MFSEIIKSDAKETKGTETQNFRDIKPESGMNVSEANKYWNDIFNGDMPSLNEIGTKISEDSKLVFYDDGIKYRDGNELKPNTKFERNNNIDETDGKNRVIGSEVKLHISELAKNYLADLEEKCEFPETLKNNVFDVDKLEVQSPEKVSELREEFDDNKSKLRKAWEELNQKEWPKYHEDVYNDSGIRIRKAGDNYDAHHVQPLELGGANTAENLTPIDLNKHSSIHSGDGSCKKLVDAVKGAEKS